MNFENQIVQWVSLDNKLKLLNEQIKEIREKRTEISTKITNYASDNNLFDASVKISNDRIKFSNTKVTEPLTLKYLEKTLGEVIKNESQVKLIMEHIKQKRNFKIVPEIKRFSNN